MKTNEYNMESSGYKADGEPSTRDKYVLAINITKMYKMLNPPKAIKQIASLNKDLFLLSSLTFL